MAGKWVDFKEVREKVDFRQVLEDYGVELRVKGEQHQGFCPLPDHSTRSKKRSASFSANLKRGIWQCFGCGAKGNVLDFAARMEGLDPENKQELRQAALLLQERYLSGQGPAEQETEDQEEPKDDVERPEEQEKKPRVVNAPLDFELKRLNPDHNYLKKRGLRPETVELFGLGFCNQGLMKERIAIPLHDGGGNLVGYAGRLVEDGAISDENPKYKFPGSREKAGTVYEFRKSEFLFNGFRIPEPVADLVVVEGFFGLFGLHQHGYCNAVALMGWACSEKQAQLIVDQVKPDGRVWVMPDGDEAGTRCAQSVLQQVAPYRFVRWVRLGDDWQPEDCSAEELESVLGTPDTF